MQIKDKVAVITGGGSGIGQAIGVALSRLGAAVVVADIQEENAQAAAQAIRAAGGRASHRRVDVGRADELDALFESAERDFGGIDIVCNNAGITTPGGYPAAALSDWSRVVDVNLTAVILGTQLALPRLRRRGGGCIVQTSSMAAFVGFAPDPVYAATKAGVVFFTHSLAYLRREGIRVNCVCPGLVDTPLLRQSTQGERPAWLDTIKMLQPKDIAEAVVGLLEDDAVAGRALQVLPGVRVFADIPQVDLPPS